MLTTLGTKRVNKTARAFYVGDRSFLMGEGELVGFESWLL